MVAVVLANYLKIKSNGNLIEDTYATKLLPTEISVYLLVFPMLFTLRVILWFLLLPQISPTILAANFKNREQPPKIVFYIFLWSKRHGSPCVIYKPAEDPNKLIAT